MCCWKSIVCVSLVFCCLFSVSSARGESILRLDHPAKKAAVKVKKKKKFSARVIAPQHAPELDRSIAYLLGGKHQEPKAALSAQKKKPATGIEWGDEPAHKIALKHSSSAPIVAPSGSLLVLFQTDLTPPPVPMAASAMQMPSSVPAPKTLWAGLGMLGVMGCWRWWAARRLAGQ
jgi:hypothetical protein